MYYIVFYTILFYFALLYPTIDENLSWKPHILNVSRKISKSIEILYKASFFAFRPLHMQVTLYYSLIYPYLIYCVSVWGSTYQSNFKRIFLLQKKLIRIISKASFDAHTGPLFKDLQILKFHNIYKYHTSKLMFLFTNNLLPNYFKSMLTSQVHSYNTRTSKLFYTLSCRTNKITAVQGAIHDLTNLKQEFKQIRIFK